MESNWFEGFITLLIIGNLILMAFYTTSIDDATLAVLEVLDAVFLSLFVGEAALKLVGLGVRRYGSMHSDKPLAWSTLQLAQTERGIHLIW